MNDDQPDPITRRGTAIRYRNPALVLDLLALLEVHDEDRTILTQRTRPRHEVTESTIGKTLADLTELGAIRTVYRRAQKRTDYRITPLGRAWIRGQVTDPSIPTLEFIEGNDEAHHAWSMRNEETR
jgi:DNA-binding PadR family transcriptional regulator